MAVLFYGQKEMLNVEERHNSYFHGAQKYLTTLNLPAQRTQSTLYLIQKLVI